MTIITENHKKVSLFIKKQKRYLIYRYFTIAIYYQLESALGSKNLLIINKYSELQCTALEYCYFTVIYVK